MELFRTKIEILPNLVWMIACYDEYAVYIAMPDELVAALDQIDLDIYKAIIKRNEDLVSCAFGFLRLVGVVKTDHFLRELKSIAQLDETFEVLQEILRRSNMIKDFYRDWNDYSCCAIIENPTLLLAKQGDIADYPKFDKDELMAWGVHDYTPNQYRLLAEGIDINSSQTLAVDFQKKKKIGRNEPCPCGSGKKYKQCCGK